ncbi:flagellar assembly factor FliW [Spirochaetia bacterium]|nr:flagellar assembly factor FliW [Spirochaetia bacterium]
MKVATKAYGLIDVDERQRIVFPSGLFGFEACTEFVLLDAERQPFYWLQSVQVEQVAFILVNPFLFRPDYEADISDGELKEIGISGPEKTLIFAIVTIAGEAMTANLQGPLIINRELRIGKQAILTDPRWMTRHNIVEELAAANPSGQRSKKAPC